MARSHRFYPLGGTDAGSGAVPLIALALLLLLGSIGVARLVSLQLTGTARAVESELAQREAESRAHQALNGVTTTPAPARISLTPTLELILARGSSGRIERRAGLLAAKRLPQFHRFHWTVGALEPERCTLWEISSSPEQPRARAALTCREFSSGQDGGTISGNLFTETVSLSDLNRREFRLVIFGALEAETVALSRIADSTIEIVAAGDLTIHGLTTDTIANTALLLHSATGRIKIDEITGNAGWCAPQSTPTALRIRFEALEGATLGGTAVPNGCAVARNEKYWISRQILAPYIP